MWHECREGILRTRRAECRLWNLSGRLLALRWSMLLNADAGMIGVCVCACRVVKWGLKMYMFSWEKYPITSWETSLQFQIIVYRSPPSWWPVKLQKKSYVVYYQQTGTKCRLKNMPNPTTPKTNGDAIPYTGYTARTSNSIPTMPHPVMVGMTLGQYASQNAGVEAGILCSFDTGNL